jgi:hypothetical protein
LFGSYFESIFVLQNSSLYVPCFPPIDPLLSLNFEELWFIGLTLLDCIDPRSISNLLFNSKGSEVRGYLETLALFIPELLLR